MASLGIRVSLLLMLVGSITAPSSLRSLTSSKRQKSLESQGSEGSVTATQPAKVVISLSAYESDPHDWEGMRLLRAVKGGRDPCKAYRADRHTPTEKIEDVAYQCSRAIRAFASLPVTDHGPCRRFKRLSNNAINMLECIPGEGEFEGYCAVGIEGEPVPPSLLPGKIKWVPLESCTNHLQFEP